MVRSFRPALEVPKKLRYGATVCQFWGAQVVGAQVVGAQEVGAQVVGAQLLGAQVVRAQVGGAQVVGAQVMGAQVLGAQVGEHKANGGKGACSTMFGSVTFSWRHGLRSSFIQK